MRIAAARDEVGCRIRVARVGPYVELAEPRCAGLSELWMEGKALHAPLSAGRLDADAPVVGVDIDILGNGPAALAEAVQRAAHVIEETWGRVTVHQVCF